MTVSSLTADSQTDFEREVLGSGFVPGWRGWFFFKKAKLAPTPTELDVGAACQAITGNSAQIEQ